MHIPKVLGSLTMITLFAMASTGAAQKQTLLIASAGNQSGIYRSTLDLKTGEMSEPVVEVADVRTGFLDLHPALPLLYAATNEKVPKGEPNGGVRVYRIASGSGMLELIDKASTADRGTTHIEVAGDGRFVAVCHYSGSGTSAIPLKEDGAFGEGVSHIAHEGSSVTPRQKGPHPHGVAIHASGGYVCVADLGTDTVEVYPVTGDVELSKGSAWKAKPGAGPRHVTFHPNNKWLYSINELDSTVSVLHFNAKEGKLEEVQTVSTLPDDFDGNNTTAEVVVHPSGKFLYGSNRGHESTAVFSIDQENGKLTLVEREPTQGMHPRFVGLDPTGTIYVAANMNSNNLVSFKIDQKTGALEPTGHKVEVGKPMCAVFVEH